MDENIVLVVDFDKICRLCLHTTEDLVDIFRNNGEIPLRELIENITGLDVNNRDGLPSNICSKCSTILQLSTELRATARRAHSMLLEANNEICVTREFKSSEAIPARITSLDNTQGFKMVFKDNGTHTPKKLLNRKKDNKISNSFVGDKIRRAPPKHLTCQICLDSFTTKEQVKQHALTHYKHSRLTVYLDLVRPYVCEECRQGPLRKKELVMHHRRHLNVNPYKCKQEGCSFIGKNSDSLRHHALTHLERSQVCELCGAAYRRRAELRQHCTRAHRAAPRACRLCNRICRNEITYQAHVRSHVVEPQFACEWRGCGKAYRSRTALETHARSHVADKPFRCHLCEAAAYTSQSLLNRHLRLHSRGRATRCDQCPRVFEEYGAFYRHRVQSHGPWQPHRCAGCNQGYRSEEKLRQHESMCEVAIRMRDEEPDDEEDAILQELQPVEIQEIVEVQELEQLVNGQALLVRRGGDSVNTLLQDLPPDGLLYIEVDPEADSQENAQTDA